MRTSKVREFNVRGSYANGYNKNVYTKRFSKPWKSFSGFGYAVGTPPFTFTPPAGYTTVGLEQVTAVNQEEFAIPSGAGYTIPSIATAFPRSGETYYAPPTGWWVAIIVSGGKENLLWISGDGNTVHGIDIDMSNVAAVGKPASSSLAMLLVVALGGYALYKLTQNNKTAPVAVKVNRR